MPWSKLFFNKDPYAHYRDFHYGIYDHPPLLPCFDCGRYVTKLHPSYIWTRFSYFISGLYTLWKLNIATENGHLCMIYLFHMVIVHSYVKLPEGTAYRALTIWDAGHPKRLRSWMVAWATPHGCSAQTLGVPAGSARFFSIPSRGTQMHPSS